MAPDTEVDAAYRRGFLQVRVPRRRFLTLIATAGAAGTVLACGGGQASSTKTSHGGGDSPDYAVVFPTDRLNQMTITVSPETWQAMLDDMTKLAGQRGRTTGGSTAAGPDGEASDGSGTASSFPTKPMWASATIAFNGLEWKQVGLRFKGSSSLRAAWRGGTDKIPFKLDFDRFEDDFPETKNQRFYGFKELSLSNNWNDATAIRESLAYAVLRQAGLVAGEAAPYEVFLDRGDGPESLGLYSVVEVIDDTVVARYFRDTSGNLYEGAGPGAALTPSTVAEIPSSFEVKSDEDRADWNDVRALYDVLHSRQRIDMPEAWRASLEAVFAVDSFLRWLAAGALLQNWDTYGRMSHNFYVYHDPATGRLRWIPWDHNLVLSGDEGTGRRRSEAGTHRTEVPFDKREVGDDWPLISYVFTQPAYIEAYDTHLRELLDGPFARERIVGLIEAMGRVVGPAALKEDRSHPAAIEALTMTAEQRILAAEAYLAGA